MKKQIKKGLALLGAAALTLGLVTVPVKNAQAEGETVAYISYADSAWGDAQYWYDGNEYAVKATTAEVTDYGQYTVSLDFTGVEGGKAADVAFFDVEIANGESAFANSYMQIDSVKVNGTEVEVGKTYTSSDDGVATRTNLYNEWVSDVTEGRTADGDATDVTPTPVSKDAVVDVETLEVTFTLMEGVAFGGSDDASAEAAELPEEGTAAYLSYADSAWAVQYWYDGNDYSPVVANNATVTGYGEYTVSLDFTGVDGGVAPDVAFFDVEIAGGEQYFPNSYMEIKSVKVNGADVEVGKTYTSSDDGIATRTNLYNEWVSDVTEGRTADGDATDVTPTPVSKDAVVDVATLEVTFELKEGVAFGGSDEETDGDADAASSSEFTAFMMFADGSGAWENYNMGVGTECTVLGDGVYEVSLSAEQCGATGKAAPNEDALVFLVDIEGLGQAMVDAGTLTEDENEALVVTDAEAKVAIFVDGVKINSKSSNIALGDIEGNGRFRLDFFNAYDGAGTAENPVVSPSDLTPESEIKVVFALSGTGLNSDADTDLDAYLVDKGYVEAEADSEATEAAAAESTSTTPDEGGSNTTVIIIVVVAVIVVAAVVIVVVSKKKKK
jgi:hypothetical protein